VRTTVKKTMCMIVLQGYGLWC